MQENSLPARAPPGKEDRPSLLVGQWSETVRVWYPPSMNTVVEDVACTLCGCVCDDLALEIAENRVQRVVRACPLAEPWFLGLADRKSPVARVAGRETTLDEALAAAAKILESAQSPLIYGLSRSSTPGQRAATRLADRLGATIDTTASRCHAPSIMALQEVGESTCSLGEPRNRADLVIYWGSNPVVSHPRHSERYGVDSPSTFIPEGRAGRHLVVIDSQRSETASIADTFLQVSPDRDFELIGALRCLVRGIPIPADDFAGWNCGVAREAVESLAKRMMSCRSGIVYFGLGLSRGASGHRTVEALLRLVTDLNRHTRFYARRMRVYGDVAGADSVLCWQTGFPFSVNLARGYPRYNPGEYSASDALERGEIDACLLVGSEGIDQLAPAAIERLREIPVIALDYPGLECPWPAAVQFTTAIYGVHAPGTAYRMDETPIPLRQFLTTDLPADHDILKAILDRIPCTTDF